jgi:hypothetical protein
MPTAKPSSIGVTTPTSATRVARPGYGRHFAERGFQSDLEDQENRSERGEHHEDRALPDGGHVGSAQEREVAEQDAQCELADDRWQMHSLGELAGELRIYHHQRESQEDCQDSRRSVRPAGRNHGQNTL